VWRKDGLVGVRSGSGEEEKYFDAEADFASCLDGCGLGLGCARGEGLTSAAYVRHVLFLKLAVDGGFLTVVAIRVVIAAICGGDALIAPRLPDMSGGLCWSVLTANPRVT
jgi:hypothetical protein